MGNDFRCLLEKFVSVSELIVGLELVGNYDGLYWCRSEGGLSEGALGRVPYLIQTSWMNLRFKATEQWLWQLQQRTKDQKWWAVRIWQDMYAHTCKHVICDKVRHKVRHKVWIFMATSKCFSTHSKGTAMQKSGNAFIAFMRLCVYGGGLFSVTGWRSVPPPAGELHAFPSLKTVRWPLPQCPH